MHWFQKEDGRGMTLGPTYMYRVLFNDPQESKNVMFIGRNIKHLKLSSHEKEVEMGVHVPVVYNI